MKELARKIQSELDNLESLGFTKIKYAGETEKKYFTLEIKKAKEKDAYVAWANMATVDRDNELVLHDAYSNLKDYISKNPVMFYDHAWATWDAPSETTIPIGKVIDAEMVEGKGLRIKFVFSELQFAQDIKYLVDNGFLNTLSIGFRGLIWVDDPDQISEILTEYGIKVDRNPSLIFTKVELLEVSVVGIPSNRDAEIIGRLNADLTANAKSLQILSRIKSQMKGKSETTRTGESDNVSDLEEGERKGDFLDSYEGKTYKQKGEETCLLY